jgi:Family of unknown function (DUF5946)
MAVTSNALAALPLDGACPGCGVVLSRRTAGPTHAYLGASSACWELYQRFERRPSAQPDTTRVRRLMHDAYAAQHPGVPQRRSIQSVAVHLMDLCVLLERDGEVRRPVPVPGRTAPGRVLDLHWLEPPELRGTMTVADALDAREARAARVEEWAREVWAAWRPHHATVRAWLDAPRA